jgi:hypothetical protein
MLHTLTKFAGFSVASCMVLCHMQLVFCNINTPVFCLLEQNISSCTLGSFPPGLEFEPVLGGFQDSTDTLWSFQKVDSHLGKNHRPDSQKSYQIMRKSLILILRTELKTLKVLSLKKWRPPNTSLNLEASISSPQMTTGSLVPVTFQEHCLNLAFFSPTLSQTMWGNPVGLMEVISLAPTKFIGDIKSCGLTLGFPLRSPHIFFTHNRRFWHSESFQKSRIRGSFVCKN